MLFIVELLEYGVIGVDRRLPLHGYMMVKVTVGKAMNVVNSPKISMRLSALP